MIISVHWKSGSVSGPTWYNKDIDTSFIMDIDNFRRRVEDDIFTFISDDLTFMVKSSGQDSNHFDPLDFLAEDYIYRLDITTDTGETYKLFVDKDNSKRTIYVDDELSRHDVVEVTAYEISSLFKDEGWYLGDLIEEPIDTGTTSEEYNTYYRFTSGGNKSISDILDDAITDVRSIITSKSIPAGQFDADLTDFSSSSATVEGSYDPISIDGQEYWIEDYYIDTTTERVFLIIFPTTTNPIRYQTRYMAEIINNTTIKLLDISNIGGVAYYQDDIVVSFAHDIDDDNTAVAWYFIRYNDFASTYKYTAYGATFEYNDEGELIEKDGLTILGVYTTSTSEYYKWKIDSSGDWAVGTESNNVHILNNAQVENANLPNWSSAQAVLTFSVQDNETLHLTTYYAKQLDYNVYRLPHLLSFTFKNATFADVLKEIAISQDALWYLSYTDTDIKIYLRGRNTTGLTSGDDIENSDILHLEQQKKIITFNDLNSQIFSSDEDKLTDLLSYYNDKYGNGKFVYNLELWGLQDYSLGELVTFEDSTYGDSTKEYFINEIEWENAFNRRRTYIQMFEIGE